MADDALDIPDKLFFRIGEVAALLGVEAHVLRYWEQEFRIRPQRSDVGQRVYRRKDIARFLQVKKLLYTQGFTIPGARRALDDAQRGEGASELADAAQLRGVADRLESLAERLSTVRTRLRLGDDA